MKLTSNSIPLQGSARWQIQSHASLNPGFSAEASLYSNDFTICEIKLMILKQRIISLCKRNTFPFPQCFLSSGEILFQIQTHLSQTKNHSYT